MLDIRDLTSQVPHDRRRRAENGALSQLSPSVPLLIEPIRAAFQQHGNPAVHHRHWGLTAPKGWKALARSVRQGSVEQISCLLR